MFAIVSNNCDEWLVSAHGTLEFQGDVEGTKNMGSLGDAMTMCDALLPGITNWQSD
jgi:hypothetical protein